MRIWASEYHQSRTLLTPSPKHLGALQGQKESLRQASMQRTFQQEGGKAADGKVLPWILCCPPELHNYTPESPAAVLISLPWACKTPDSIITRWKGSTNKDSGAGERGWAFVMQKSCVQDSHGNTTWAGPATHPHSGVPSLLPSSLGGCSHILTPKFPVATYTWAVTALQSLDPPTELLAPWLHKAELWKEIIWKHLKVTNEYHCISLSRSSEPQDNWAQRRNLTQTAGSHLIFCKTWRDMWGFFPFSQTESS